MRPIKFRAWGKRKQGDNVMYLPATLQEWMDARWKNPEDFVWMQFTGLHDKNGKEIYEGDVVSVSEDVQHAISEPARVSVVWRDGGFMTSNRRYIWLVADSCEVIGNIYENPDLLK